MLNLRDRIGPRRVMADVDTGMGHGKAAREGVAIITTVARSSFSPVVTTGTWGRPLWQLGQTTPQRYAMTAGELGRRLLHRIDARSGRRDRSGTCSPAAVVSVDRPVAKKSAHRRAGRPQRKHVKIGIGRSLADT